MENVLTSLQAVFVTLYATYYNAQTAHWHVTGPRFHDLHSFFGEEYSQWADEVDTVAEHIRTHYARLPNSLKALAENTPDVPEAENGAAVVDLYLKHLNALESAISRFGSAANAEKSDADIDLAGELARMVKKSIWKTSSIAKK